MKNINDMIINPQDPQEIFEILDLLGQGAYGTVSKALHKPTGELVAIKIITNEEINNIKKQIIILKECDSQYIVKYFGAYYKDNNLWIVMEYCVAGSVIDVLKITKKELNEFQIASILQAVLRGLDYLHRNKKIHRDIKAANVLLDQRGNAKLADFGVSTEIINTHAQRNTFIGSPYWMSPELLSEAKYNSKTDIWSLGITAIQIAEGAAPYSNMHPFRAMWVIKNNQIKGLHEKSKWSEQFNSFISSCLKNKPEDRPTAFELLEHPFIVKKAKGRAILSQLVLNSMDAIQKYRIKQSKKRFSMEQDNNTLQMKFIQEKKQTIKLESNTFRGQQQQPQEVEYYDSGTLVIKDESLKEKNGVTEIPQFMKFAKKQLEVQELFENKQKIIEMIESKERKNLSQEQLRRQIQGLDKQCQIQINKILDKYKEKIQSKNILMKNLYSKSYDKASLKAFSLDTSITGQAINQIKNINNINSINISITDKKLKKTCASCQKQLKQIQDKEAFKKNKKFKQFVDDNEVFEYLKKNYIFKNK